MKLTVILSVLSLFVLSTGVGLAADPPKCPPDKVTIEKYCKAEHKDKAKECIENLAKVDCKILKQAVKAAQDNPDPSKSLQRDCEKSYYQLGGTNFLAGRLGCMFWLSHM